MRIAWVSIYPPFLIGHYEELRLFEIERLEHAGAVNLGVIGQGSNLDLNATIQHLAHIGFLGRGQEDLTRDLTSIGTLLVLCLLYTSRCV